MTEFILVRSASGPKATYLAPAAQVAAHPENYVRVGVKQPKKTAGKTTTVKVEEKPVASVAADQVFGGDAKEKDK